MKRRTIIFTLMLITCIGAFAQKKLGDYIEINSVPAFVFYLDQSGEHGLAMSAPALSPKQLKKADKYIQRGVLTKELADRLIFNNGTLDLENYKKADMLKRKSKEALFTDLISHLSGDGKQNAIAINEYCKNRNLSLKDNFPWEYWAQQLGDSWYIPGDNELTMFAEFYAGGLNKKNKYSLAQYKKLSEDERVRDMLMHITFIGLMSSTAKFPEYGFRTLHSISTKLSSPWFELLDNLNGATKETCGVVTCAVHEF